MPADIPKETWSCEGWADHGKLRRELTREMSFAERLRWLENATRGGRMLQAAKVVGPPAFARRPVEGKPGSFA
jgi:hypothetical protein